MFFSMSPNLCLSLKNAKVIAILMLIVPPGWFANYDERDVCLFQDAPVMMLD
jgi:hypothetical protein